MAAAASLSLSLPPDAALSEGVPGRNPALLVPVVPLDTRLEAVLRDRRCELVKTNCFLAPKPLEATDVPTQSVCHRSDPTQTQQLLDPLHHYLNPRLSEVPLILKCIEAVLAHSHILSRRAPQLNRSLKDARFEANWGGGKTLLNIQEAIRRATGARLITLSALAQGIPHLSAIAWTSGQREDHDPETYHTRFNRFHQWAFNCSDGLSSTFRKEMHGLFRSFPEAIQAICEKDPNLLWEVNSSNSSTKEKFAELSGVYKQLAFFFLNLSRFLPLELGAEFFKSLESSNSPLASSFQIISNSLEQPFKDITKSFEFDHETPSTIQSIYTGIVKFESLLTQLECNLPSNLIKKWARERYSELHPEATGDSIACFNELPGFSETFFLFYGLEVCLKTVISLAHRMCWDYFATHLKGSSTTIRQHLIDLLKVLIENTEFYTTHMNEQLSLNLFQTAEEQNWRNVYQSTCCSASRDLELLRALLKRGPSLRLGELLHQINWMNLSMSAKDQVSSSDQRGEIDQVSSSDQRGEIDQPSPSSNHASFTPPISLHALGQIFIVYWTCHRMAIGQINEESSILIGKDLVLATEASDKKRDRKIQKANASAQQLLRQEKKPKPSLSTDSTTTEAKSSEQHSPYAPLGLLEDVPDLFDPHSDDPLNALEEKIDAIASSQLAASAEPKTKKNRKKKKPPPSPLAALPPGTVEKMLSCLTADAPNLHPPIKNFALWAKAIENLSAELSIDRALTEIDFYRRMIEALFHFLLLQGNAAIPNTHNLHELATLVTENPTIATPIRQAVRDNHPLFSVLSHANEMTHYPFSHHPSHRDSTRFQKLVLKMGIDPKACHPLISVTGQTITALVDTIVNPYSYSPPRAPHPIKTSDLFSQEPSVPLQEDPLVSAEPEEDVLSPSSTAPLPPPFVRNSLSAVATIEALLRMIRLIQLKPVIGDEDHPVRRSLRDEALKNGDLLLRRSLSQLHPSASCALGGIETVEIVRKGLKELVIALLYHHPIYENGWPIASRYRHTNSLQFVCSLASRYIPSFHLERPLPGHLGDFHRAFNYPHPYHYHEPRHGRVTHTVLQALERPDAWEEVHNQWLFPLLQSFLSMLSANLTI